MAARFVVRTDGASAPSGGASRRGRRNGEGGTKRLRQRRDPVGPLGPGSRSPGDRAPRACLRALGTTTSVGVSARESTPPLSSAEGAQNLARGARSARPPPSGRALSEQGAGPRGNAEPETMRRTFACGRPSRTDLVSAPTAASPFKHSEVQGKVHEGSASVQLGPGSGPGEDGEDRVERPRSRPTRRNRYRRYPGS